MLCEILRFLGEIIDLALKTGMDFLAESGTPWALAWADGDPYLDGDLSFGSRCSPVLIVVIYVSRRISARK